MPKSYNNTIKKTIDLTGHWIEQLDENLGWEDKTKTFRLLRFTLQALRDILPINEAAQFSAQLPLFVKGMFFEGWNPSDNEYERHDKEGFFEKIEYMMMPDEIDDIESAVTSVFQLLNAHISPGEIMDVRANLKKKLQDIWPPVDEINLRA